jgi:hypothetical protein
MRSRISPAKALRRKALPRVYRFSLRLSALAGEILLLVQSRLIY